MSPLMLRTLQPAMVAGLAIMAQAIERNTAMNKDRDTRRRLHALRSRLAAH